MKRGGELKRSELVRRTPLRAKAGLKSNKSGLKSNGGGLKRSVAQRRGWDTGPSKRVVALVFDRDGGRCVRCGSFVHGERGLSYSLHHRLPRRSGGSKRPELNLAANLVTLCGSATTPGGCHTAVESARAAALAGGWLLHANQEPAAVPVESWWGWVFLDDAGRWTEVPS